MAGGMAICLEWGRKRVVRERERESFSYFSTQFFSLHPSFPFFAGEGGWKIGRPGIPPPSTTILRLSINTQKPVGQAWFVWCHFLPFLLVTVKADEKNRAFCLFCPTYVQYNNDVFLFLERKKHSPIHY